MGFVIKLQVTWKAGAPVESVAAPPADAKLNVVGRSSTNEKKAKKVLWPIRISIFYYYAK